MFMQGKTGLYILVIIFVILLCIAVIFYNKKEEEENFNNPEKDIEAFSENWNYSHKSLSKDWKPKKVSKLELWCPTNPKDARCITY